MKNTGNKFIKVVVIVVYLIIIAFIGKEFAERSVVKYGANAALGRIKQGLDNEMMNKMVDSLIYQVAGDGTIGTTLQDYISGEDINEIYAALMNRMAYKITGVEKTDSGSYRVGIVVSNNNNLEIGKLALIIFRERYGDDIITVLYQAWQDLNTDKSQLITSILYEAASYAESELGNQITIAQNYVVAVNTEGDIYFENENGMTSFICVCLGIPVEAGQIGSVKDECKIYGALLAVLIIIPIIAFAKYSSDKKINKNVPMLYACSPQHNNIPFAIHDEPIIIGRNPSCCKVLFKEDTRGVSGKHCSVSYDNLSCEFIIKDLGSSCGTFLSDGEKLIPNKAYRLVSGDDFYIADKANVFKLQTMVKER